MTGLPYILRPGSLPNMPDRLAVHVAAIRDLFPALHRSMQGRSVVYFDGPAGTQVPETVIEAIGDYLRRRNANHGGVFATSRESDAMLHEVHRAAADLLGASDGECVAFGPNMTTLTFHFSRALSRTWSAGDEIIVTRLDHDANVRPWVLAAADRRVDVRWIDVNPDDCTLDWSTFERALTPRTRLVAVGMASNAVGTVNPVERIVSAAHRVGAEVFVDAVHWAPHRSIDVEAIGCDYLVCSAYKFFGPHIGMLWGRRERMEALPAYKLRPVPDTIPDRWMTGTQNHESLAGVLAAIDYLAELGRRVAESPDAPRRTALLAAYEAISAYETALCQRLIDGLQSIKELRVWGITDRARAAERLPTVAVTHDHLTPRQLAERLGQAGIFAWHGNYYAVELTSRLGLEPDGMLRLGIAHYNTVDEVEYVVDTLRRIERRDRSGSVR